MIREPVESVFELTKQIIKSTPLSPLAEKIYHKYETVIGRRHPIQNTKASQKHSIVRLGTKYGGWAFVDEKELHNSPIISAGLGEDASFDVEFAQKYDSEVIIVDPTPRAIQHFEEIKQSLGSQKTKPYAQIGKQPVEAYELSNISDTQLNLIQKALWKERTELEFYKPRNESQVSHSIINWQHGYSNDTDCIEVKADTITSIINNQDIPADDIHLIKLDIEGAEIEVIEQMMSRGFKPRQILVEFDELNNPSSKAMHRVDKTHNLLLENGYELIHSSGGADFLYYRDQ